MPATEPSFLTLITSFSIEVHLDQGDATFILQSRRDLESQMKWRLKENERKVPWFENTEIIRATGELYISGDFHCGWKYHTGLSACEGKIIFNVKWNEGRDGQVFGVGSSHHFLAAVFVFWSFFDLRHSQTSVDD